VAETLKERVVGQDEAGREAEVALVTGPLVEEVSKDLTKEEEVLQNRVREEIRQNRRSIRLIKINH
jgi:hypothetical protein